METKINETLIKNLNFEDVLLDSLPNPVYYKDIEGRFIRCNSSFAKLIHKEKEEIIGKLAYNFFSKETSSRHKIIDETIMKTLERNEDRIVYIDPKGETKYLNLCKAVYLNDNGKVGGIVCVMSDITKKVKEKELLIQKSKLAEMGEMIGSIAHQWHEPLVELSALVQQVELLYSLNKIDNLQMTNFVKNSMRQIKYMTQTLNDFRNFLKPSTEENHFNIKKALREVLDIVSRQIFYCNIHLSINYEPSNEKIILYGYKNEFKQVLLNIINNAKNKISNSNSSSLAKSKIIINVCKKEEYTLIEIKDNGQKIDEEIIDKIFDPFFTTKVGGTGFGLYLAKLIIEDKMYGKIDVQNSNDFVVFSIKIPSKGV